MVLDFVEGFSMPVDVNELDKKTAVLETKVAMMDDKISKIEGLIDKLHEKLDILIHSQAVTKTKTGMMFVGYGCGIAALVEIFIKTFVK